MKTVLIFLICIASLYSCSQSQKSSQKFIDKKGKFQVSFPDKPNFSKQSNITSLGEIISYSFIAKPKNDNNKSYRVNYLDYPKKFTDTLTSEHINDLFYASQETNFNSASIQLLGNLNLNILGYIGKEFKWLDNETGVISRIRYYMVKNRMYILSVETETSKDFSLSINRFFESFELIDTKQNTKKEAIIKKDKVYNVQFPNKTETREMDVTTKYGNAKITVELFQPKLHNDNNLIYMVQVTKYTNDITKLEGFDIGIYYSDIIQANLLQKQSKLTYQKEIQLNGNVGIEVKENIEHKKIITKQRTFLKENMQIDVKVMTIPSKDENEAMNKFFKSFILIQN